MKRPRSNNTRHANADEKRYHGWIKESEHCAACRQDRPVNVHHCMGSTYRHNKRLIGHIFCIGLCGECDEIVTQGSRREFTDKFGLQGDLWQYSIGLYTLDSDTWYELEDFNAIRECGQ